LISAAGSDVRYSVLIPTFNEASTIAASIESAKAALGAQAEIIVSDGGSTDETRLIAAQHGARVITSGRGRGSQLDAALHVARGEICIFLHADTKLPRLAGGFLDHYPAGAFLIRFENNELPWLAAAINIRSLLFKFATGDQAMFARRDLLLRVGGVPRVELFEDVRLWRELKRAGRVTLVKEKVTTSARLWNQFGTWRVIFIHWRLRLLHRLGVSPARLARMYPTSRAS
jgi:rSAM/selenodomain-associated transferase 2